MKYDWITKAIENKGVLTTSQNSHGIYSTMHFKGKIAIVGDHHTTLTDALTSLNSALQEDWVEDDSPIANAKDVAAADTDAQPHQTASSPSPRSAC